MNNLFLGIKGHVVCIDKATGDEIWRTHIKSNSGVTNVCFEDETLFVYSGGHVFCVDPENGQILWENMLPGLGYGPCVFASESQSVLAVNELAAQATSAGSAGVVT